MIRKKNSWIDRVKKIYFPIGDRLSDKYSYAKHKKILLPIAWLHRILNAMFISDHSISDKIKLFIQGNKISKNHEELLSWLEL